MSLLTKKGKILGYLQQGGWCVCKNIAEETGIKPCSVRNALDALIRQGCVRWKWIDDTPDDERALATKAEELGHGVPKFYQITDLGRQLIEKTALEITRGTPQPR